MLDEPTRTAIALKKFSIISPLLNGQDYGARRYSPKTIGTWYSDYLRHGIDALKPKPRNDIEKHKLYPKVPVTVIYSMLISEGAFTAADISLSTVTRFFNRIMKRFAHSKINQLWQTDLMYGPYIKNKGKNSPTYLLAYIDDCSRLILHAQFYFSQVHISR